MSGQGNSIYLKDFVIIGELFDLFQYCQKSACSFIEFFMNENKKLSRNGCISTVKFNYIKYSHDEFLNCQVYGVYLIDPKVFVDPYFPLMPRVDDNHFVIGLEKTKDVHQYFISYQHLLQKMNYLRGNL